MRRSFAAWIVMFPWNRSRKTAPEIIISGRNTHSPLEHSKSVIHVLSDYSKELSSYSIFLHFLIIARFGNDRHARLQWDILFRGLGTSPEFRVGVLHRVMVLAVFLQNRAVEFSKQIAVLKAVAQHIETGLDLLL